MTPEEQVNSLRDEVLPKLGEFGIEAFCIIGYMRLDDGRLQRVCFANTGTEPVFEDAMRQVIHFAHVWSGAIPKPPTSPCAPNADE